MVILGLLLVLAALVLGALAVYGLPTSGAKVSWDFLGNSISISPTMIFFLGVAAAVALALGLWLMALGARHSARKRRELKDLRRDQRDLDRRERDLGVQRSRESHDTVRDGQGSASVD